MTSTTSTETDTGTTASSSSLSNGEPDITFDDIDLTDLDLFAERFPHDWFTFLRKNAPVWWHPPGHVDSAGDEGFWVVSKYDDIVSVHRSWQTFSSHTGGHRPPNGGIGIIDQTPEVGVGTQMIQQDPPGHTRLRKLVNRGFTPKAVRFLEQHLRQRAIDILDAVGGGEGDFVVDVAAELPLQAIAELVGVPMDERDKLFDWSNRIIGSSDPEYKVSEDEAAVARGELFAYATELAAEKRKNPAEDIWSKLVDAEVTMADGTKEKLSEFELHLFFFLLIIAGNETTRNAISHGMLAFFEFPDQWKLYCEHPELSDTAVEEVLRWSTPVAYFRRTATEDTEIRGQPIAIGDKVTVWYPSANQDEEHFENPFALDITRDPNHHISFGGGGPHFCLGAHLARLEIKVIFEELARRFPNIEQISDAQRLRMNLINGIKHFQVAYNGT